MKRVLTGHPAAVELKGLLDDAPAKPTFQRREKALDAVVLDEAMAGGDTYTQTDIALKAAAAVQEFAETGADELDAGEGLGDRLFSLIAGIADENMDGEIGESEAAVMELASEAAYDYLVAKGVSPDDAEALVNDYDNDLAATVQELVAYRLPDGDEAAAEDIDAFAFGDGSDEPALDAVYKKRVAIRGGKKVMVKKRVSGTVRLSAKQKVAVRKMLRKTHSAAAQMRRAKSMRVRSKMMGK